MTTTIATMTMAYSPLTQLSNPDHAPTSPILLRRGRSATPFLQRTPVYHTRNTASVSRLTEARPPLTPTRSSTSSAPSTPSHPIFRATDRGTPPSRVTSSYTPSSVSAARRSIHARTSSGLPRDPAVRLSPPPPPPTRALPPVPFPAGPPTPPEDEPRKSIPSPRSRSQPARRPVSRDTEDTLRELEMLAASLKRMPTSAPAPATGRRHQDLPPVKIGVSCNSNPVAEEAVRGVVSPVESCQSRMSLAVPHIVVTNPSSENLLDGADLPPPGGLVGKVRVSGGDMTDDTEEVSWVEGYGAWGTSEKGKWKAIVEEDDEPTPMQSAGNFPEVQKAVAKSYIYEPAGAPDFLVGSSTSRDARAATGYRSTRPVRRRTARTAQPRRRPTPLVLANPEEGEVISPELELFSALLFGTPSKRQSKRPQTAPHATSRSAPHGHGHSASHANHRPPSAWPTKRNPEDFANVPMPRSAEPILRSLMSARARDGGGDRHSEPLPAMPRVPLSPPTAVRVLRGKEQDSGRQVTSWASASFLSSSDALSMASGTSSEPTSPRPGHVRPRLKSFKGLFKHWSK